MNISNKMATRKPIVKLATEARINATLAMQKLEETKSHAEISELLSNKADKTKEDIVNIIKASKATKKEAEEIVLIKVKNLIIAAGAAQKTVIILSKIANDATTSTYSINKNDVNTAIRQKLERINQLNLLVKQHEVETSNQTTQSKAIVDAIGTSTNFDIDKPDFLTVIDTLQGYVNNAIEQKSLAKEKTDQILELKKEIEDSFLEDAISKAHKILEDAQAAATEADLRRQAAQQAQRDAEEARTAAEQAARLAKEETDNQNAQRDATRAETEFARKEQAAAQAERDSAIAAKEAAEKAQAAAEAAKIAAEEATRLAKEQERLAKEAQAESKRNKDSHKAAAKAAEMRKVLDTLKANAARERGIAAERIADLATIRKLAAQAEAKAAKRLTYKERFAKGRANRVEKFVNLAKQSKTKAIIHSKKVSFEKEKTKLFHNGILLFLRSIQNKEPNHTTNAENAKRYALATRATLKAARKSRDDTKKAINQCIKDADKAIKLAEKKDKLSKDYPPHIKRSINKNLQEAKNIKRSAENLLRLTEKITKEITDLSADSIIKAKIARQLSKELSAKEKHSSRYKRFTTEHISDGSKVLAPDYAIPNHEKERRKRQKETWLTPNGKSDSHRRVTTKTRGGTSQNPRSPSGASEWTSTKRKRSSPNGRRRR